MLVRAVCAVWLGNLKWPSDSVYIHCMDPEHTCFSGSQFPISQICRQLAKHRRRLECNNGICIIPGCKATGKLKSKFYIISFDGITYNLLFRRPKLSVSSINSCYFNLPLDTHRFTYGHSIPKAHSPGSAKQVCPLGQGAPCWRKPYHVTEQINTVFWYVWCLFIGQIDIIDVSDNKWEW